LNILCFNNFNSFNKLTILKFVWLLHKQLTAMLKLVWTSHVLFKTKVTIGFIQILQKILVCFFLNSHLQFKTKNWTGNLAKRFHTYRLNQGFLYVLEILGLNKYSLTIYLSHMYLQYWPFVHFLNLQLNDIKYHFKLNMVEMGPFNLIKSMKQKMKYIAHTLLNLGL
jgi:hypothetical protein